MPSTGAFSAFPFGSDTDAGPVGVTGLSATGGVGSVSINGDADAVVTGLQATSSLGQVLFSIGVNVTGVGATGGVGTAIPSLPENVSVTGVSATMPMTGGVGAVTVTEGAGINVAVGSGSAQGQVGVVTAIGNISVLVTGVAATGATSGASVVAWNEIIPNQDPNWTEIAA